MKNGEIIVDDFLAPLEELAETIEADQENEKGAEPDGV